MPEHHEICELPYTAEQMYDLVLDIESYPEFVPWCSAARIIERSDDTLQADLAIRFKAFQEKYTSRVIFNKPTVEDPHGYIIVELIEGPFAHLKNIWKFDDTDNGSTIDFNISFKFKNKILDKLVGVMFEHAQRKMVNAFKERADKLYSKERVEA